MSELVFTLPDVGEGLAEAEVIDWLVPLGAAVRADQPVVTVETAKAQVELPAPADGVLRSFLHDPGDTVAVGAPLFVLDTADADAEPAPGGLRPGRPGRVLAAPSTRRFAVTHGLDLRDVRGTGPSGRVLLADAEAALARAADASPAAAAPAPAAEPVGTVRPSEAPADTDVRPLRGLRRQVARAMTAAWQIPHITEFREIDATELERAHRSLRADAGEQGTRLTLLPLLVRVVVAALRRHPEVNATVDMEREEVTLHRRQHIGIAAATPDGLVVPVLHDAGRRSVPALAREIARLGDAARDRSLTVPETTGATFTVSNFGSYGTWLGTPLINAPQVAIAGFGRVRDAVVPVDGVPAVRRVLPVAVSADHRVLDGDHLGSFVNTLERLVRTPLLLLGEED
ncbi:dihydrolipoamide acetyltransferase family protein [Blastococcus sp. TF02A-26]|uniref:dihydrolipoamide acetyltransferase family protein n=1 Tax=Blastococcus sp. TF02A-26 TaxID=2250577 RepID=UPI000DEA2454|nr:dihydrolipoamide acetyltransferase family protein [Blastococcus sp. TF02A-26]RBY85996.1 2-oxo acid dehydrogenase subunit E2 [Blastococcus sp. TF02A-26]